ncbi:MAG: hypothetical protein RG740_03505 [Acholeplasmataceae bacterium]|nr:hypothetical protein [Acholeplasmataceae bacterium]
MKKIILLLFIVITAVGLASCKGSDEPVDLTIQVAQETFVNRQIEVHVIVPIKLKNIAELNEIAMNIASQKYEEHFDEIGTQTHTLTIYVYASSAEFTANNPSLGTLSFDINKDITSPGLSILENALKIE